MAAKQRLVIVGNGMAGGKLLEEIVARDPDRFDMTVIGNEPHGNYNRIKLVLKLKEDNIPDLILNPIEWYAANNIKTLLGTNVVSINREKKTVMLTDGREIRYDTLVLATGSRPIIPPMEGLDLPGIFALRNLDDVDYITEYLRDRSHVMVVGGGLLGIEMAQMLRLLGKKVTVSHLMPTLMEVQIPEVAGRFLQRHLESLGINFVMNTYITELVGSTAGVNSARFKDGRTLHTEAVFFNCGIRPNTDLARNAGLVCNRGVAVDNHLRTNDPSIYACGECLEYQGDIWGLVAPVYEQARTLAALLCGEDVSFVPSAPAPTRLKSDVPVISMGRFKAEPEDDVILYTDPASGVYKRLVVNDGYVRGAVLVGEDLNSDLISLHYTAHLPLPPRSSELLFPGARAGDAVVDGKMIPDDAQICGCNGVSAETIRQAIKTGSDTLAKVMQRTSAGTGCGNCKGHIKALLISEVGELREDPADKWYVRGVPMMRTELESFIKDHNIRSVSQLLAAVPDSADDFTTKIGLDFLLNFIWRGDYTVERDARTANDRYHGNIQKDGRYSVIPNMAGGLTTADELRAIAEVADEFKAKIKVTGADRIGLYSIKKEDLPEVWKKLGMGSGHAYTKSFRSCKSCVGSKYCRFGIKDSLGLAERLGKRYRGVDGPAKFKMGVSGCPRNCAEATIKDFGVVAIEGGWDLFVGGNGGAQVAVAQKIATVENDEQVVAIADRFYEFYRRHAKYGERAAPFIERVGLKTVTDAIINGIPQEMEELEKDMQATLDSYRDPWEEELQVSSSMEVETTVVDSEGFAMLTETDSVAPGGSQHFLVEGVPVAVFHGRGGEWVATHARCPHKGGSLAEGIYGDGKVVCPIHHYSYDAVTGECNMPDVRPLAIFETRVADDKLWVRIEDAKLKKGASKTAAAGCGGCGCS